MITNDINKGAAPTKIDITSGAGVPGGFTAQNTIEQKSDALNSAYSSQLSQVQSQKADLTSKLNDPKYNQEEIKTKLNNLNKTESSISNAQSKASAMKNKGFSTLNSSVPKVSVPKVSVPSVNLPTITTPKPTII